MFAHPLDGNTPRPLIAGEFHDTYATVGENGELLHWRIAWDEKKNGLVSELMTTHGDTSRKLLAGPLQTARFTFGSASPIRAGVRCTAGHKRCVIGEKQSGAFVIFELHLQRGRGNQVAQVADGGGLISWDIAPDGERIAFMEARLDHATSVMRIYERGSGHIDIELDRSCSPTGLDWATEDELFLTCFDEGGHMLVRVGIDGKTDLLHRTNVFTEMWQPMASPDSKRLLYRQDMTPSAMWLIEGW